MPLYKYECQDCQHQFREIVFDKGKEVKCPECLSSNVKRQIGRPSIRFNGKGFYKTDYSEDHDEGE